MKKFLEKLAEISGSIDSNKAYSAKFMDKRAGKQSIRNLVVQNFDNYEESKTPDVEFGTPAQRLAYQRVSTNHRLK